LTYPTAETLTFAVVTGIEVSATGDALIRISTGEDFTYPAGLAGLVNMNDVVSVRIVFQLHGAPAGTPARAPWPESWTCSKCGAQHGKT
jgi:hypothetical protein